MECCGIVFRLDWGKFVNLGFMSQSGTSLETFFTQADITQKAFVATFDP